jgi:hypothetical protein
MDNFYSTVFLFWYLHNIKQNVIGTTQSNRISPFLLIKKKKPYSSLKWIVTIRMNNKTIDSALIFACLWRDSSVIYFMSILHWSNETTIIQRQSRALKIDMQVLIIAEQYYKFIKSINIVDQLRASYMTCQKTKRWYLCLFYWCLDRVLL